MRVLTSNQWQANDVGIELFMLIEVTAEVHRLLMVFHSPSIIKKKNEKSVQTTPLHSRLDFIGKKGGKRGERQEEFCMCIQISRTPEFIIQNTKWRI